VSSATTATFSFVSGGQNASKEPVEGTIDSDTFMFYVKTNERVTCRYSTVKDVPYESMTNTFEYNFETDHKKVIGPLSDGVYRYFVKCKGINGALPDGTTQLEAIITINARIGASISMDSTSLSDGKYEVFLSTTKIPMGTPTLSYSYDGVKYTPIILHGSEKSWKGYLIIPKSTGEKAGTFKFEAKDLESRIGTKIYSGETFTVDTSPPRTFSTLDAIGEYGQIRLEWHTDELDMDAIRIYRSTEPGVDISDFYRSIDEDEEYFIDTDVSKGKTYYYKVAGIDSADNLGEFSREVSAAPRNDNSSVPSGLSSNLVSLVDALLTEIDLIKNEIKDAGSISEDIEDIDLDTIGVKDELKSSSTEISALEKEVVAYKLQDLTRENLETRLSSSRVKLNMIKRNIPTSVSKTDSDIKEIEFSENSLRQAILRYSPGLTPSQIEKAIRQTKKTAEENELNIKSEISIFEIIYLDGSTSQKSIVKHSLNSILEKTSETLFLLELPDGIENIDMQSKGYEEIGLNMYKFETDTKVITYLIEEELDPQILNDIEINLIKIPEESTPITGYFLSNVSGSGSIGIAILIVFAISLVIYLTIMKNKNQEEEISEFIKKARNVKKLWKSGQNAEAGKLYESLKSDYIGLSQEQKTKVFNKISNLHKK
jgi:hypothetical protein